MNVLVYNGPEVAHASFNAVLSSLRTILLPHYSVQQVELSALAKQPWSSTCALLVFPRLSEPFQAPAHTRIQDYVERGGAFLAFGAGASCSTRGLVTGMEHLGIGIGATNASSLKFFDKFSNAYIRPTFGSSPSDAKPSLVQLEVLDRNTIRAVYEAARAEFTGFQDERGIKILGRYDNGEIAGLGCDVGIGRIALWSPNLEVPLTEEPASALVSSSGDNKELDKDRRKLLKRTIIYLGLQLPAISDPSSVAEPHPIARPFPQFLVSSPDKPQIVSRIIDALSDSFAPQTSDGPKILKDSNDTLHFHESASTSTSALLEESKTQLTIPSDPSTWQPKHIIILRDGTLPSTTYTSPYFNLSSYFSHIASLHQSTEKSTDESKWPIGSALFFSPAVTSTQTLLDKNPIFLSSLPTPIVSLASHQLSARGRGSNVWLSPAGSLSYSVHLRLTAADGVPWSKLVFVQYLFALAVCEGVRDDSVLGKGGNEGGDGEGSRIRIKWPNDVYALVGSRGAEEKKKVAGILVNTNFGSGGVDIVIGCGLNIFNDPPSTSLAHLLRNTRSGDKLRKNLSIERTAAVILSKFEEMWTKFISSKGSFEPFMDLYLERWLHSDQLVTLTTTSPPTQVRIAGITLDHGLLRTVPERKALFNNPYLSSSYGKGEEEYIDLQPDGNSFDLMAGMIKAKQ